MLERFRGLVEAHQHQVYTLAVYVLGNTAEAEDITQEVMLKLWHHVERVECDKAGAWLTRVTRNACYDLLRSRRSRRRLFQDGLDTVAEATDGSRSPEQQVSAGESDRLLREALAGLDEPYRTIAVLREVQEKSYLEIAEAMDLPLNTVKTYLHRARRRLREALKEVFPYAKSA